MPVVSADIAFCLQRLGRDRAGWDTLVVSGAADTAVPAEAVWAMWTELERWPVWSPLHRSVTAASQAELSGVAERLQVREIDAGLAHTDGMPVRLHHIVIDTHDLPGLARFWTQALGWKVLSEREREIVISTDDNAPVGICFMPVTDPKTVKNRVHIDLTASAADRDSEIERLLALGARRVDIGQTGAESWTVLADPEGNEFCVIRPKETLTR